MSSLDDRHVALQGGGHLHLHLQHPPPPYTVALILSFDDISLLFLYFRYRIESTLAPRRPSLSSSATVFRSWRGNRLSRLCNSITYRSSDSLLDLSMMYRYIYIYIHPLSRGSLRAGERRFEKKICYAKGERFAVSICRAEIE